MEVKPEMFGDQSIDFVGKSKLVELADLLKEHIKKKADCFEVTNLVFPNANTAQWFRAYWLSTESDVLMNVKYLVLDECLYDLLDLQKRFELAKRHEIRAATIKEILSLNKEDLEPEISGYIYDGEEVNAVRLYDLANRLSQLFCDYEKDAFEFEGWQKNLYDSVVGSLESHGITTFSRAYEKAGGFQASKEDFIFFGFNRIDDLYLKPLQQFFKNGKAKFYALVPDEERCFDGTPLLAAPSKTREIEALHSKICSLVKDEGAKFSDFLVLSPDTSVYERDIVRVFNQDNEQFPNVPFNINSKKRRETDVTIALKKLFEICAKKFFTRLDFAEIINNKCIQQARDISPEDVQEWQQSIIEMNVYRNGKRIDDWAYAKKRLVLSKVADINSLDHNIVELSDDAYMPYTRVAFDDDSIIKFVKIIDDLQTWIVSFADNPPLKTEHLDALKDQLIQWFSIKDLDGIEQNDILLKLLSELNLWRDFGMGDSSIPLNTLFYTLFDRSQEMNVKTSSLFVDGVTFADYEESSILKAKYLFFIGANSNDFPPLERQNEIDLRPQKDRLPEQYANFKLQCANAENLCLSYVNLNLKTGEDYFPSTFVLNLLGKPSFDPSKDCNKIPLDETRDWSDLFTKKEFKEKDFYVGLFQNDEPPVEAPEEVTPETVKKVTVSQMKNFLTEPLKFKFESLFGRADETDDLLHDQYEPITADPLTKHLLIKSALLFTLKHPEVPLFDAVGRCDIRLAKEIFRRFLIEHKVPNVSEELEDLEIANVMAQARDTRMDIEIATRCEDDPSKQNYEIVKIPDFHFKDGKNDVLLMFNDELCRSVQGNVRKYIELSSANVKPAYSRLLTMYVCALMDVATLKEGTYQIEVKRGCCESFEITPAKARELIGRIYHEMNSFDLNVFMPLDLINTNKKGKKKKDKKKSKNRSSGKEETKEEKEARAFEKMVENAANSKGAWGYFKDKKLFKLPNDLGFTRATFSEQNGRIKALLRELVLIVGPEPEEEE